MPRKRIDLFPWLVCGLGAFFYCYEYFLRILPSVMTEDLLKMFNINGEAFGNLVAFYYYAYTPMQLPVGMMMDRFGPRKLLAFACLVCAIGTYLFAHHYLSTAQMGRFLVGFGSAFAFVGVLKLAAMWFPPSHFAFIAGMATSLGAIGAMFGDIILSKLVFALGSNLTLYITATLGLLLTVALWYFIPESKKGKINPCISTTQSYREFFQAVFKLCKNPQLWLVGVIGSLLYLSLSAFAEVWGIPYLIRTYGLSDSAAATNISFIFLGWAIGSPLIGWISDKIGNRRHPVIIGALLGAFLFTLLIYFPFFSSHFLGFLLFSFGLCSSAQIIVFLIARELNVQGLAGTAIAVTNSLVMLGGALSEPLVGKALDLLTGTHARGDLMAFSVESFQYALTIIPISFIIAAFLAVFVRETCSVMVESPVFVREKTGGVIAESSINREM
jgi:MFS family permease